MPQLLFRYTQGFRAGEFALQCFQTGGQSFLARAKVIGLLAVESMNRASGIDLSEPALELAAVRLDGLTCEVDPDHRDFFEALTHRTEHADTVHIPARDTVSAGEGVFCGIADDRLA